MKKGLITSILVLTFGGLQAQPLPATPKLVVTLTVDQLRTDYMEAFSSLYGEQGFKRLLREGRVFSQMELPFKWADRASALATIYTGSTPSQHGIIAENRLDAKTLRPINCMDDPDFMGNYTDEHSSPSQLLVSTFADELKVATQNRGFVYSIAPFREAAILGAGHSGNGAFWLNEATGKWCSTTYYNDFPWWITQYNEREAVDFHIKDVVWTPMLPTMRYTLLPGGSGEPFKHKPDSDPVNKFRRFATTPFVNEEVNRMAERLLDKNTADASLYRIPNGEFYLNRCATLLNMYLMATYGEGQYVEAYHNLHIYLNHKLIEDKQLDLAEIQEKAAGFLMQFSGVSEVYSAHQLLLGSWSPEVERIRNAFCRNRSGDLLIEVLPGWTVMQENSAKNYTVRCAQPYTPLILWGSGILAGTIRIPVSADRIAPTLSSALRIRAPNACTAKPLQLDASR